jgi:hypothetical protein
VVGKTYKSLEMTVLHLVPTARFWVLEILQNDENRLQNSNKKNNRGSIPLKQPQHAVAVEESTAPKNKDVPMISLVDLLLHKERKLTNQVHAQLFNALQTHGFVFLHVPPSSAPGRVVEGMKDALHSKLFPKDTINDEHLQTSDQVYLSERGVPMWKLGYERSEDGIREFFRVHTGCVDDQPWPYPSSDEFRSAWLQGVGLCRHVCDTALELCCSKDETIRPHPRPSSGKSTWTSTKYSQTPIGKIADRSGDFSVLYAMHYFNQSHLGKEDDSEFNINVKQHVDPSLFVLEPFLCQEGRGLQVFDPCCSQWIDCDGPYSPVHGQSVMCLFVGKAFARHCPSVQPTLHRVVASTHSRRSIIYEQKYEEYWE